MTELFNSTDITREARISIILNTFMYTDRYIQPAKGATLRNIVGQIKVSLLEDFQKAALAMMKKALSHKSNTDIADLELVSSSESPDSPYRGAYCAVFRNNDCSEVYVVFRGTGNGRWYDNGDALANSASKYQQAALSFFDDELSKLTEQGFTSDTKLIVTGHSKGGNLSQFVTLRSKKFGSQVKYCISFDGQGFSPEFLSEAGYPNESVNKLCNKMYSICGDNDYVNVLGNKIIPDKNTTYIQTRTALTDMYGAHSITPESPDDVEAHCNDFLFNFNANIFNEQTSVQRKLALCAKAISANTMSLSQKEREEICHSLMTLAEKGLGGENSFEGLNGEKASLTESIGFLINLYQLLIPMATQLGNSTGQDVIVNILVVDDGVGNSSLASASFAERIAYVMTEPDILKLYYLGASIALELIIERAAQLGYIAGKLTSTELTAKLTFVLSCQLSATNMVTGFISGIVEKIVYIIKCLMILYLKSRTGSIHDIIAGSSGDNNFLRNLNDYLVLQQTSKEKIINGTPNDDNISGGDANETIYGFEGNDHLHGWGGDDKLYGGKDDDHLYGEGGSDKLYGEEGSDVLKGGDGDDSLHGGAGNDDIRGEKGNDILFGSLGDDTLNGGEGNDTLRGGAGNDTYVFVRGFGRDVITDDDGSETIEFRDFSPSELNAVLTENSELIIGVNDTFDSIIIKNYSPERFSFSFGGENYILTENNGALTFIKAQ